MLGRLQDGIMRYQPLYLQYPRYSQWHLSLTSVRMLCWAIALLKTRGFSTLLLPFQVMMPQKVRRADEQKVRHGGITYLALGVFLGVLTTGYVSFLIQMYATAAFNFHTMDNGYLMAINSLIQGLFLILIFSKVISTGR